MAVRRDQRARFRWIALVAAHFLVLQTFYAAFATGAGATTQEVDAFGVTRER